MLGIVRLGGSRWATRAILARTGASRSVGSITNPFHHVGAQTNQTPPSPMTPQKAAELINSGDTVFVQGAAATPNRLLESIVDRHSELTDVRFVHMHTEGPAKYLKEEYAKSFRCTNLFTGSNARHAVQAARADYIPVFLSEIPLLFRRNRIKLDVALVQVSPPDRHGFVSLGTSVDTTVEAVDSARLVIAQINPNMPRTHGDGVLHINNLDAIVVVDEPLPEMAEKEPSDVQMRIGEHVASLIEDGSCLQMGIGGIPNAVLACLGDKKGLGIHTEMFSDGIIDLVEKGVLTGEHKENHKYRIVCTFLHGSKKLYDFVDDNPLIEMRTVDVTNSVNVIQENSKVCAINSAVEVDMSGQVCADSIGGRIISGVGGQMDFMRGASLSEGGKPIIALPSVTSKGISRIVPFLKEGAGVTTTRAHVHYVVTEYGIANLWGKSLVERAEALTAIAHPDHRDTIADAMSKHIWLK